VSEDGLKKAKDGPKEVKRGASKVQIGFIRVHAVKSKNVPGWPRNGLGWVQDCL